MMNSYQSSTKLSPKRGETANEFKRVTDSPNYSAHKSNDKFFKTIDQSPYLGARSGSPSKGTDIHNRSNKFRSNLMWDNPDSQLQTPSKGVSKI
jgi:hypothetical protein